MPTTGNEAAVSDLVAPAWASADLYHTIVATANQGIWLIDRAARTVFINDRMAQWLDEDTRAMIGRAVPEFCFPEDRDTARARIASNFAGHPEEFTFRFRRHDGSELPVEAHTSPARDASGAIVGALGLFLDLRDRRNAEWELRAANAELAQARAEAEARAAELEAIFQALGDGLMVHDATGALVRVNEAGRTLLPLMGDPDEGGEGTALDSPRAQEYGSRATDARMALYVPRDAQGQPLLPDAWPLTRLLRGERLQGAAAPDTLVTLPDGRSARINISGAPLRDATGQITGAVSIVRDVTEQRRLEESLRESEQRLRAVLEVLPVGAAIVDAQGKPVLVNEMVRHIWGEDLLIAESAAQYGAYKAWWPGTGQPVAASEWGLARSLAQGEVVHGEEMDIETFDGQRKTILGSSAPLRDVSGAIAGAVSVIMDVTERRALTRRTQEALEGLLALAEALVIPPVADPPRGGQATRPARHIETLRHLAALCRQVLATDRVAVVGMQPDDEVLRPTALMGATPDQERAWRSGFGTLRLTERFSPQTVARLRKGEAALIRMRDLRRDDPAHVLSGRYFLIAPLLAEGTLAGYIGVNFGERASDYSPARIALTQAVARLIGTVLERDRLQHERELARGQVYALEETTKRMDEFMGIASHEIRTPITSLQANLQLAHNRLDRLRMELAPGTLHPEGAERLEGVLALFAAMQRQLKRQNRLVEDLMDTARISVGTLRFHFDVCDLRAVVREEVEQQRLAWPNRTIHVRVPRAPVIAQHADADRIAQVLANYLVNALKFSQPTQPVAVRLGVTGEMARVAVRDAGPGLARDQRALIWQRYGRAPNTPIRDGSGVGLGLGLYIGKTIIERHGGQVGVSSALGAGSTFWFTLPLAPMGNETTGDLPGAPS